MTDLERFAESMQEVRREVARPVVGLDEAFDLMLIALLCGGHALIEGVPGTAKTLMVRALGAALRLDARRIQFTPDLMPADIVGTNVFHPQRAVFETVKGPVFCELLLADEINRTPPRTQAALLEAMQERQVTLDGARHELSPFFTVYATQNPIEFEGTYPLPEALRDRFLLWIEFAYPTEAEEDEILRRAAAGTEPFAGGLDAVRPVLDRVALGAGRALVRGVRIEPAVLAYVRKLVRETRRHDALLLGAGPRAGVALLVTSRARAALGGRDFVTPDDVKEMVLPVLRHRLILKAESELEGLGAADVLREISERVEVPR
jgi:MoxR-like ATPase